jgi:hypothetical protein
MPTGQRSLTRNLGRHSIDMTLRYAKIANRTVADE